MIEVSELEPLLILPDSAHLPSYIDKRIQSLDPSGVFCCRSYFQFLTKSLNRVFFWTKLSGNPKFPLGSNLLSGLNTRNHKPITILSLNMFVMCCSCLETRTYLVCIVLP